MRCGLCGFLIIKPQTTLHHVVWCGFLIIKPQTTLHHAVWCGAMHYYLRCGAVRLCHFVGSFDAVYAAW